MSMTEAHQEVSLFEKGVLAAVLDDSEVAGVVAEILEPSDFAEPRHEMIFSKALQFYQEGLPFDVLQMVNSIANDGNLDKVGGYQYFMEILDVEAVYANADPVTYALNVREFSQRRALSLVGMKIQEQSRFNSGEQSEDIVAYMQSNVQDFSSRSFSNGFVKLSDIMDETLLELEDAILNGVVSDESIPTGFIDLDDRIGGLFPGQMVIIAGRPASGKTTLALDFARNASILSEKSVLFFSLEMSQKELSQKLLSAEAHVEHSKIRLGKGITQDDYDRIKKANEKLKSVNLYVDDNPELDLVRLQAKCLKQSASPQGLDLVIIDYLQLMKAPPGKNNREQEIAEISRNVKIMAKKLGVPIIILAQLNRGNVNRTDKTPMVSDLRESGSLEQDADMVLLVHRPEVFDPNDKPGITEIIAGKVRAGQPGTVDVISLLEYSKFANGTGMYRATEEPLPEEYPDGGGDIPPMPEEDVFSDEFPVDEHSGDYGDVSIAPLDHEEREAVSDPGEGGMAW